jgi:hypothetical protein
MCLFSYSKWNNIRPGAIRIASDITGDYHNCDFLSVSVPGPLLPFPLLCRGVFYSYFSANRHDLDAWVYLRDVIVRPADLKPGELEQLLSDRWQDSHAVQSES